MLYGNGSGLKFTRVIFFRTHLFQTYAEGQIENVSIIEFAIHVIALLYFSPKHCLITRKICLCAGNPDFLVVDSFFQSRLK